MGLEEVIPNRQYEEPFLPIAQTWLSGPQEIPTRAWSLGMCSQETPYKTVSNISVIYALSQKKNFHLIQNKFHHRTRLGNSSSEQSFAVRRYCPNVDRRIRARFFRYLQS